MLEKGGGCRPHFICFDQMISVITVCYNAARTIEQTISSVVGQTYSEIELIVVDGASTDDSMRIVQSFESRIASWVSEPDQGISDAMNKGLRMATGSYILYLNADDYLADRGAIERIVPALDHEIVAAPIIKLENNQVERLVRPRGFNWWLNLKAGLFHQATLCSRQTLLELDGFETQYKLEMDYDLFLRAYRRQVPLRIIDQPFSVMRSGGVSTRIDAATLRSRLIEEKLIHYRNCPSSLMRILYAIYWQVYPHYKLARGVLDRHRYG